MHDRKIRGYFVVKCPVDNSWVSQVKAVDNILRLHSGDSCEVIRLFELPYTGGTNDTRNPTPMFTVGYKLKRAA